jgi:hypothetical protein
MAEPYKLFEFGVWGWRCLGKYPGRAAADVALAARIESGVRKERLFIAADGQLPPLPERQAAHAPDRPASGRCIEAKFAGRIRRRGRG